MQKGTTFSVLQHNEDQTVFWRRSDWMVRIRKYSS